VVNIFTGAKKSVRIAVVGKYIDLHDSYKSVDEALYHGGIANECRVELKKIDSEKLEKQESVQELFESVNGILIPGGFGQRGIEGMIKVAKHARENQIPYFGICLGMQVMVIEYARSVLKLEEADSTEFKPDCAHPVISLLEEQIDITNYGGTMRLGQNPSILTPGSKIHKIYGKNEIYERHRHRYEVSNAYRKNLDNSGLKVCGVTPDGALVETMEWDKHVWGIGVQFHPEFKSKPINGHPLFCSFIYHSLKKKETGLKTKELISNE
jgi:CTP synthase